MCSSAIAPWPADLLSEPPQNPGTSRLGPPERSSTSNGSGSSDPDGDALTYTWSGPFGVLTGAAISPLLEIGVHAITLIVADGHGWSGKATLTVTVNAAANSAPSADAGPDQVVEATSPAGAAVVLDGSASSDPDHDSLTLAWSGLFGAAAGVHPSVQLPLGAQTVTLAVDDGHGHSSVASTHVTVRDTRAPTITCGGPDGLWHAADVAVACTAADAVTGLADPSRAAFALATSVASGMETAGAATGALAVCDVAGNCATAGPIGGHKVDRKPPSITFDPSAGTFAATGSMRSARAGQVAIRLADGRVLLAGGVGPGWTFLASAELYDPSTGTFTATGAMGVPRESHAAARLADGRVLVAGGHRGRRSDVELYTSLEIYAPSVGTFAPAGDMTVRRHKHDAILLADGGVLISGGTDERDFAGRDAGAEIFDPRTGRARRIADMRAPRYKHQGTSVRLPDGRVLLAGGADRAEIFDPGTESFQLVEGEARMAGQFCATAPLANGGVLITGGYGEHQGPQAAAWLYGP